MFVMLKDMVYCLKQMCEVFKRSSLYYSLLFNGSQPEACVKKLWKNSGCTTEKPYGSTYKELGDDWKKGYKALGIV